MKKLLTILAAIGILLLAIAYETDDKNHAWLFTTFDGLGAGLLISVLLIWLYDESRARQDASERSSRERRIVRRLKLSVGAHYRMLQDCYRSATLDAGVPAFDSVNDFIGVDWQDTVKHLDLFAASPMRSDIAVPYHAYIDSFSKSFRETLQRALDNHAMDMGEELAGSIEGVLQSPFLMMASELSRICEFSPPGFPPKMMHLGGTGSIIGEYGVAFCRLLNAMEEVEPQGLREFRPELWRNTLFAPGHARRASVGAAA